MPTTSGEPRCSAPYSMVPRTAVSTTLPALRATNNSPRPTPPKMSSGETRLSEQVRTVAQGDWSPAVLARSSRSPASHSCGAFTNLSLPAFSLARASSGLRLVLAEAGQGSPLIVHMHAAAAPVVASDINFRRLILMQTMHMALSDGLGLGAPVDPNGRLPTDMHCIKIYCRRLIRQDRSLPVWDGRPHRAGETSVFCMRRWKGTD